MSFLNRFIAERPEDNTLGSVVRNLRYLFNSKRGYGSRLREFGLGSYYAQQGVHGSVRALMRELFEDIQNYEPRLVPLDLKVLKDRKLPLAFELRGELRDELPSVPQPTRPRRQCRLSILFDPVYSEIAVFVLEPSHVR